MKIKTIIHPIPESFDAQVNEMLAQGYILGKRSIIKFETELFHYAQMVQLDSLPEVTEEPLPMDPVVALSTIRDFCDATRECTKDCQLHAFCNKHLPACEGPADWKLPGEEADV